MRDTAGHLHLLLLVSLSSLFEDQNILIRFSQNWLQCGIVAISTKTRMRRTAFFTIDFIR